MVNIRSTDVDPAVHRFGEDNIHPISRQQYGIKSASVTYFIFALCPSMTYIRSYSHERI
jgi:hypothetical protein